MCRTLANDVSMLVVVMLGARELVSYYSAKKTVARVYLHPRARVLRGAAAESQSRAPFRTKSRLLTASGRVGWEGPSCVRVHCPSRWCWEAIVSSGQVEGNVWAVTRIASALAPANDTPSRRASSLRTVPTQPRRSDATLPSDTTIRRVIGPSPINFQSWLLPPKPYNMSASSSSSRP